jgi:hypothetical protein
MLRYRVPFMLSLFLFYTPSLAWGQAPPNRPVSSEAFPFRFDGEGGPTTETTSGADAERQVSGTSSPFIANPDSYPAPVPAASAQTSRIIQDFRIDATVLPSSVKNGLTMTDLEFAMPMKVDGWVPLAITPYVAAHYWTVPTLPRLSLYDLNVEFAWHPRLANWLFADVAVTPGFYSDFEHVNADSFQMRGRAMAIVALSENLQFVGGAMYVNRLKTKVLPAGGVIWNPSEDTRLFLVFPQPKVSHRFTTIGNLQIWGHVAGEFGGGRWGVERAPGINDSLDYTDLRLILGLDMVRANLLHGHIDVGYAFNRHVNFAGDPFEYTIPSTIMLRAGIHF